MQGTGQAQTIATMLRETDTKPPRALAVALDAWDAATPELADKVDVHQETLTIEAKDVPDLIERLTMQSVRNGAVLTSEAFATVKNLLDRRVAREFTGNPVMGKVWTAYGTQFATQTQLLTDAATRLPATLDIAQAANGSPDTLAAWAIARDAAQTMNHLRNRRDELAEWGVIAGGIDRRLELASRFAGFPDRATGEAILAAEKVNPFDVWVTLVRIPGVTLRWSTLEEQVALVNGFGAEDIAAKEAGEKAARQAFQREMRRFDREATHHYEEVR